jgi:response regulator of citrate/malate metabolism
VFDLIELFTHWHAGRSQRQLAESVGIDRKTIAKYLAPAISESVLLAESRSPRRGGRPISPGGFRGRRSGAAGHDLAGH